MPESGLESFLGVGMMEAYCCIISATCWQNVSDEMEGRCRCRLLPPFQVRLLLLLLDFGCCCCCCLADLVAGVSRRNGEVEAEAEVAG